MEIPEARRYTVNCSFSGMPEEKLTAQVANTINDVLKPQGVGVTIKASESLYDHARRT